MTAGRRHGPQLTAFSSSRASNLTLSQLHTEPRNGDAKATWLRYHLGPFRARRGTPPPPRGSHGLPGWPPTLRCHPHRTVSRTGSYPPHSSQHLAHLTATRGCPGCALHDSRDPISHSGSSIRGPCGKPEAPWTPLRARLTNGLPGEQAGGASRQPRRPPLAPSAREADF